MKKVLSKNGNWLLIGMFFLLLLVHLPLLIKPILTADVLLNNSYYNGYAWEISLGRFGLYVIGLLKGFVSIPIIEIILSFILIILITFFIIRLFKIDDKVSKIMIGLLMILSPIVSATLLFHYCSVPYLIAFLCGILSVYFYYEGKNKWVKYLVPICLIVISLSMYQAYLSLIVTVFILYQIRLLLDNQFSFKKSGSYLLICLAGMICYFICMKLSLIVFHIDMASYSNANQIGISTLLQLPKKIIESYQLFYQMFFTNQMMKNTYLFNTFLHLFIFISFLLSLGIKLYKSKISMTHKILIIVLVVLMPVFLNSIIFVIADSKLQLLMSASYLVFFIFIISFSYPKYLKLFVCVLFGLLYHNYLIQDQATYLTLEKTYSSYETVIDSAIKSHMNELDKPFIVVGEIKNIDSTITNKNYGYISDEGLFWDEYNLRKLGFERFCQQTYGLNLHFGDEDTYQFLQNDTKEDIIYEYDNNIIINLNNYKK